MRARRSRSRLLRVDAAGAVTSTPVVTSLDKLLGFGLAAGADGQLARIAPDGQTTSASSNSPSATRRCC